MINKLFIILMTSVFGVCQAQKNELGIFIGSSGYYGDIGHDKFGEVLLYQSPAIGFFHKINFHDYLSYRSSCKIGTIKAEDSLSNEESRRTRNLKFQSQIIDLSFGFEFNFYKFFIKKRHTVFSPYIYGGISFFTFNPQAKNNRGEWVNLQSIGTEGQGTLASKNEKYPLNNWAIPFGLGYKVNYGQKIAFSIEWTWHPTKTDYLDDVSGYYADEDYLSQEAAEMANPGNIEIVSGKSRGNPNNNDWYNFFGFTMSYKIKNKPIKCPKSFHL